MIPVSSVLLCSARSRALSKRRTKTLITEQVTSWYRLLYNRENRSGTGGCLGKAKDRAAKRRSTSSGRMLPRWDVEMAGVAYPARPLAPSLPSSRPSARPPPARPPGFVRQLTNYRGVKGKFCFNHSRLFLSSGRHSSIY